MPLPAKRFATLAAALLLACLPPLQASPADDAARARTLLIGNGAEPPSIDPQLNTSVNGSNIISALIEGLIAYHPYDDNLPEPGMAQEWSHDGSYRVWTFRIRDANWSNGDPVTAHDFVFSYHRMLTPALGASYAEMLYMMKGAEEFHKGQSNDFSTVGVRALDDKTLQIELRGPTPYFLNVLKHSSWFPVHPPTIRKYDAFDRPDSNWTREGYVGNGPFLLKEWETNKVLTVVKNPGYWDADKVRLNAIKFFPIDNMNTEDLQFSNGELHYTSTVPGSQIPIYLARDEPTLRIEPYLGTYFYRFNTRRKPLDDPRIREALTLSINRNLIIRRITKGGQTPANAFTPPGIAGYEAPTIRAFNPRRAKELMADAGYPDGKGFPKLTLLFNTSEAHKAIAEFIQETWKNILGIDIELRNQEWKVYLTTINEGNYDIARAAWIGDYVYPDTFLNMWRTGDGNNRTGWSNPEYDRLISQSFLEADAQKRLGLLARAEAILLDELPIAPIYFYSRNYRIDPRVKNWQPKLLDNRNYKYIYFAE